MNKKLLFIGGGAGVLAIIIVLFLILMPKNVSAPTPNDLDAAISPVVPFIPQNSEVYLSESVSFSYPKSATVNSQEIVSGGKIATVLLSNGTITVTSMPENTQVMENMKHTYTSYGFSVVSITVGAEKFPAMQYSGLQGDSKNTLHQTNTLFVQNKKLYLIQLAYIAPQKNMVFEEEYDVLLNSLTL